MSAGLPALLDRLFAEELPNVIGPLCMSLETEWGRRTS